MTEDNEKTVVVSRSATELNQAETLLSEHQPRSDAEGTLVRDSADADQRPPEHSTDSSTQNVVATGSVINKRFVIDKLLGRGGMGVVYRALDKRKQEAQDRNPFVAIKILGDRFRRHPVAFVALQREARKSQELAHPNIITVYDFDRDNDIVYMTMEQLTGKPLDRLIRENPAGLPRKQAEKIIKSIAQGLAYAHSKKIVHSDLKPGNIFVTDDGNVKILDFGIARAAQNVKDGESQSDQTLFDAGDLGGLTPAYASVEMFEGLDPHPSDDVYALALICYEIFTGEHPFNRERACDAIKRKLKPQKIKNISVLQWRTIVNALEFSREKRIQDAGVFLKKYEGFSKVVLGLASALVLVVVVLGSMAIFRSPDLGPDTPFESLPKEMQQRITESVKSGYEAFKYGDINGALIHFNSAYELHPRNEDAVEGLNSVVKRVLNVKLDKSNKTMLEEQRSKIEILLNYSSLSDNKKLKDALQSVNAALQH